MVNLKDFYELMSNFRERLRVVSQIKKIQVLNDFCMW